MSIAPSGGIGWGTTFAVSPAPSSSRAAAAATGSGTSASNRIDTWETLSSIGLAGYAAAKAAATAPPPTVRFTVNSGTAQVAALSLPDLAASVYGAAASQLGAGTDDVAAAVDDGMSLNQLADLTHTSRADLLASVQQSLPGSLATSTVGRAFAQRIANTSGPITEQTLNLPVTTGGDAATRTLDITLSVTADLLGTTARDLSVQLTRGATLNDLADAAGVSHDDLLAAVQLDLPAETPGWDDPAALAEQITTSAQGRPVPSGVPATAPGVGGMRTQRFLLNPTLTDAYAVSASTLAGPLNEAVANRLGILPSDVQSAQRNGYSLDDLASITGISHGDLVSTIQQALPDSLATSDVGTLLASQIAGVHGPLTQDDLALPLSLGGRGFQQAVDVSLPTVAGLLGTNVPGLAGMLANGRSLNDLADAAGLSRDDLVTAIQADLPEDAPDWGNPGALAAQIAASTNAVAIQQPVQRITVNPGVASLTALNLDDLRTSVINAVATRLGTGTADVTSALADGGSLTGLAAITGTSRADLLTTLQQVLPPDLQTSDLGKALAQRLADESGPITANSLALPASAGGRGAQQSYDADLTSAADLLGLSAGDLNDKMSRGLSLSDLADARGIAHDALVAAITADLPDEVPGWQDQNALAEQIAAWRSPASTSASSIPTVSYATAAARYTAA